MNYWGINGYLIPIFVFFPLTEPGCPVRFGMQDNLSGFPLS